jgi:hypothetical protein
MEDFIQWQELSEATGVNKARVNAGEIAFEDSKGTLWRTVPKSWTYSPRYAPNAPKVSTTKKIGAKPTMQMVELPAYEKLVKSVNKWIGDGKAAQAKGVIVITAKDESGKQIVFGRYLSKDSEPTALDNKDFTAVGFPRATKGGSRLVQLTANQLIAGAPTATWAVHGVPSEHFIFTNLNSLKSKILENMASSGSSSLRNPLVIAETKRFLDAMQKTGNAKYNWNKVGHLMNDEDRRKIGIFLVSELGWPFIVWGAGASIGAGFPGLKKLKLFAVPTGSTNAAYDSCLKGLSPSGEEVYVYVSSKATLGSAKGARGSAIPKLKNAAAAVKDGAKFNNPFFGAMVPYIKNIGAGSPGAGIVFGFGIREIAKVSSSVIPDPVRFWNLIVAITGYEAGHPLPADLAAKKLKKYSAEEIDQAKKGILAVQKKFAGGITLPGLRIKGEIDQNIAQFTQPTQWKKFAQYLPHALCKLITQGLNHDSSDITPPSMWQVTADNTIFIDTGAVHLTAKKLDTGNMKLMFDAGKNPAHDPTRDTSWIGIQPL